MKKTFALQNSKKTPARLVEAIKNEIRKYIKRERNKELPEDMTYWEFNCRFGKDSESATSLKTTELTVALDKAVEDGLSECYIEILSTPIFKPATEKPVTEETPSETETETKSSEAK